MSVSRYKKVKIEKKVPFFKRKESFVFLFLLVCGLVTIIGSSYAVFTMLVTGNKGHSVMAGTFKVEFEESETIQLLNTYPMSDTEGLNQKGYTFTITNVGTVEALYRVRMVEDQTNTLGTDFIQFVYQKNSTSMGEPVLLSSIGSVIETNQTLAPSESATYTLKMWLKEEAGNEVQGTSFQSKIVVDAVQKIDGEFDDLVGPVVTLNGEKYPTVFVNHAYTDPGVSSIVDNVDGIISTEPNITYEYFNGTNTTVVNGIDTSKVGIYYIYYRGSDLNGNMGVAVRVLRVVNELSTPPTITLTGEDFVRKGIGSTYTEEGATAVDADGVNLTDRVITVGSINTRIPGTYFIKYFVIDRSNNISSVIRQIQVVNYNPNILSVYQYNASSCITGEESTCVEIGPKETYTAGTIIQYRVNNTDTKYFHVMFDNKDAGTLTMQQRENTIYGIPWYETANDNSKGPLTVLPALEKATAGWTNVNDQTYTMGVTPFQGNKFTGCTYTECTTNKYTFPSRTAKARMITVQETHAFGCTRDKQSCPAWMNNYLSRSMEFGGTINVTGGEYGSNIAYWAMSSYSSDTVNGMEVSYYGRVGTDPTTYTGVGARAVVVINKK